MNLPLKWTNHMTPWQNNNILLVVSYIIKETWLTLSNLWNHCLNTPMTCLLDIIAAYYWLSLINLKEETWCVQSYFWFAIKWSNHVTPCHNTSISLVVSYLKEEMWLVQFMYLPLKRTNQMTPWQNNNILLVVSYIIKKPDWLFLICEITV